MSKFPKRWIWATIVVGAVSGCVAATLFQPRSLSAAAPQSVPGRVADLEAQLAGLQGQIDQLEALKSRVAELQERLAGLERDEDGRFVFRDPVVINYPSSGLALRVVGDTVMEAGRALPVSKPTLLVAGRTQLNNGEDQSGIPAVNVVGYLVGDVVEGTLLLCDELRVEEQASSPVVECDILTCSDTALFEKNVFVERDGTLQVQGVLDARQADVRLPPGAH